MGKIKQQKHELYIRQPYEVFSEPFLIVFQSLGKPNPYILGLNAELILASSKVSGLLKTIGMDFREYL